MNEFTVIEDGEHFISDGLKDIFLVKSRTYTHIVSYNVQSLKLGIDFNMTREELLKNCTRILPKDDVEIEFLRVADIPPFAQRIDIGLRQIGEFIDEGRFEKVRSLINMLLFEAQQPFPEKLFNILKAKHITKKRLELYQKYLDKLKKGKK